MRTRVWVNIPVFLNGEINVYLLGGLEVLLNTLCLPEGIEIVFSFSMKKTTFKQNVIPLGHGKP